MPQTALFELQAHRNWTIEILVMALSTVFVTGASGFIGSHVVKALRDREVRLKCLVRPTSDVHRLQATGVELVRGDLLEPESYRHAIPGCDAVIHSAGLIHSITFKRMIRTNATATGHLADACASVDNPPRLVGISSLAAAGPPPDGSEACSESDLPSPVSDYGRSKRQSEMELQKRASRIPITVIRPGIVYGPRDHGMAEIAKPIYRRRVHPVVGLRQPALSFIFIEDLVRLIIEAVERAETLDPAVVDGYSSQGIYFACDDSEHPDYRELGRRIAKLLDRRVVIVPLLFGVGFGVSAVVQAANRLRGRSSLLNVDKVREGGAHSWACSSEKAQQQLGLAPESPLDVRLKETLDWYVREGWI
jgi:nucleoside-diphosphate-sugar epimerase